MNRKNIVRLQPAPWEFKDPARAAFETFKDTFEWDRFCEVHPSARILHDCMKGDRRQGNPRRYRYNLLRPRGHVQGIADEVLRVVECNLDAILLAQQRFGESTRFESIVASEMKCLRHIEADFDKAGIEDAALREVLEDFEAKGPKHLADHLIRVHGPWSDYDAATRRMRDLIKAVSDRTGKWGAA